MNPVQTLTDEDARLIERAWKQYFPDSSILPVIGYPSYKNTGVVTLTHTMGDGKLLKINGLTSKSPLSNNALYSTEVSGGRYINLYEIMIPDIPGTNGAPSTAERYVSALRDNGLDIAGVHFHWFGSTVVPNDKGVTAVHHQKIGMNPIEFIKRTATAIKSIPM
jgi:hypothetical protein